MHEKGIKYQNATKTGSVKKKDQKLTGVWQTIYPKYRKQREQPASVKRFFRNPNSTSPNYPSQAESSGDEHELTTTDRNYPHLKQRSANPPDFKPQPFFHSDDVVVRQASFMQLLDPISRNLDSQNWELLLNPQIQNHHNLNPRKSIKQIHSTQIEEIKRNW